MERQKSIPCSPWYQTSGISIQTRTQIHPLQPLPPEYTHQERWRLSLLFSSRYNTAFPVGYTCPFVVSFWCQVTAWLSMETDLQLNVSLRTFLFGVPTLTLQARIINFILLFAQFFINHQKLFHQASMDLTHFLCKLRQRLQVGRYITFRDNKPHRFAKWRQWFTALG